MLTLPNGLVVEALNRPNTRSLYAEIFVDGVYDFPGLELRDGDVVVDVGANIGLFALWCLRRANVRLTCFEPNLAAFTALEGNIPRGARCEWKAVSSHNGYSSFTVYPHLPELCTLYPNEDLDRERSTWLAYLRRRFGPLAKFIRWWLFRSQVTRVRCTTLAEAVPGTIDLLKVDAEKADHEVLDGLGDWSRVKQIIVENHLGPLGKEKLDKRLCKAGFAVQWRPSNVFIELGNEIAFGRRA